MSCEDAAFFGGRKTLNWHAEGGGGRVGGGNGIMGETPASAAGSSDIKPPTDPSFAFAKSLVLSKGYPCRRPSCVAPDVGARALRNPPTLPAHLASWTYLRARAFPLSTRAFDPSRSETLADQTLR